MNPLGFGVLRPRITGSAPRLAGALTAAVIALGLTGGTLAPATALQTKTTTAMATSPDTYEERVQRIVNRRRAEHGLSRLRMISCADATAERWSSYLAGNNAFFHQSMTTVLDRCDAVYAGETLGRGSMTPRKLVRMWMESPGHRAVLLSTKARRIGVGATPDAYGRWVVAANFVRL